MSGAIRSVAIPWLARLFAWRDWQRWSELYSLGVRKAIAPASADEAEKERFFHQVTALGAETTVLVTHALSGEKYDLEMLWPNSQGTADGFERLLNKCESRIAIRLLGQNLTTEVRSGSLAAARVHENVKLELLQFDDRTLSEDLRAQVLRPYCRFNFAGGDPLAPRIGRKTAPTEDRKNEAETLSSAAQALAALLTAGAPVDVRAFADRFGVPLLAPPGDDESVGTSTRLDTFRHGSGQGCRGDDDDKPRSNERPIR
jgi:phage gp29-like protein